jgi:hypothetical protein
LLRTQIKISPETNPATKCAWKLGNQKTPNKNQSIIYQKKL